MLGDTLPGCPGISPGVACHLSGHCFLPAKEGRTGEGKLDATLFLPLLYAGPGSMRSLSPTRHSPCFCNDLGARVEDLKSTLQGMNALMGQLYSRESEHTKECTALPRTDAAHLATMPKKEPSPLAQYPPSWVGGR